MRSTARWLVAWLSGCALLACGGDEYEDPARQRLRTEVLTMQAALRAEPESPILHYQLGLIYERYGLADSARLAYRQSARLQPAFAPPRLRLAGLLVDAGQLREAEAAFAEVARIVPDNAEALNNLGYVRRQLEDYDGAAAAYLQAIEIDTTFAEAMNNLAQVYRRQGRYQEAADWFLRTLRTNPDLHGTWVNLVKLLEESGDTDNERAVLEQMAARFDRQSAQGRFAAQRLEELGPAP